MALTHGDHKRIALGIAAELRKVLGSANGNRLAAKHKARMSPMEAMHPGPPEGDMGDGADMDDIFERMAQDQAGEKDDSTAPPFKSKKPQVGRLPPGHKGR